MSPEILRSHLVLRIAEGCPNMKAADYLIGVEGSGLPKTLPTNGGGAFEIRWGARAPLPGRQTTLQRMRRVFAVRSLHASVATRGMEQHDKADANSIAMRRALLETDKYSAAMANVASSIIYLGSESPETQNGGSSYFQQDNYQIDYTEDLGVVEE